MERILLPHCHSLSRGIQCLNSKAATVNYMATRAGLGEKEKGNNLGSLTSSELGISLPLSEPLFPHLLAQEVNTDNTEHCTACPNFFFSPHPSHGFPGGEYTSLAQ